MKLRHPREPESDQRVPTAKKRTRCADQQVPEMDSGESPEAKRTKDEETRDEEPSNNDSNKLEE